MGAHVSEDDYIAQIDGTPISLTEYNRTVQMNQSNIMNYFREKYNAELTEDFWNTAYGDEIPLEVLKKKALEDSVNIKVRQMLAKEQGIVQDISYPAFLSQFKEENAKRAKALEKNEVVYGPAQYNEESYFEYVLTNTTLAVKQNIQASMDHSNEQSLKNFYHKHKDELYKTLGLVRVQVISASFMDQNHQVNEFMKKQAKEKLSKSSSEIVAGASFANVARTYTGQDASRELTFNFGNEKHNSRSPLAQASLMLSEQQTSRIIEENGSLYLVKCIEKVEPGSRYTAYEDIKGQVLHDYINSKYDEFIRNKLSESKVIVNEKSYQSWKFPS